MVKSIARVLAVGGALSIALRQTVSNKDTQSLDSSVSSLSGRTAGKRTAFVNIDDLDHSSIFFSVIMSREAEDDFYDITKPIEFKSKDVDDGFQHFWLPMIFMAMPGKNLPFLTLHQNSYDIVYMI